jgi:ribonucleoside-diphosphate reductase alpha chain
MVDIGMKFGEHRRLPDRRACTTFDEVHRRSDRSDQHYTISVGFFDREEREPAKIFVNGPKVGSELEAVARDYAILWSIARQYGIPVDVLAHAMTHEQNGEPSTITLLKCTLETRGEK